MSKIKSISYEVKNGYYESVAIEYETTYKNGIEKFY